jgi:hypothetical protein
MCAARTLVRTVESVIQIRVLKNTSAPVQMNFQGKTVRLVRARFIID